MAPPSPHFSVFSPFLPGPTSIKSQYTAQYAPVIQQHRSFGHASRSSSSTMSDATLVHSDASNAEDMNLRAKEKAWGAFDNSGQPLTPAAGLFGECFQFAGFAPSDTSIASDSVAFSDLSSLRFEDPALASMHTPVIPHSDLQGLRYTADLISDDDELLSSDWRWKEAVKHNNRTQLLENLIDDIEAMTANYPPAPFLTVLPATSLAPQSVRRTKQKYPHLRDRVTPPAAINMELCNEQMESDRDAFGPRIEVIIDEVESVTRHSGLTANNVSTQSHTGQSCITRFRSTSSSATLVNAGQSLSYRKYPNCVSSSDESIGGDSEGSEGYHCSASESELSSDDEDNNDRAAFPLGQLAWGKELAKNMNTFRRGETQWH
ncbi:hypothetical protein EIP91_006021 [Steccherinum ochraceum]|uniref:Uncharacterized protein n=1 Tax=Steccherinum ochraceum TaxID=92696 RepID=A0A4R0RC89_9APHY|nr:hypothetical protein EIP91_006021 [Steccherinum ochraceum]